MIILGIHDGQDPSAALLKAGEVIGFQREAHLKRGNEAAGFPRLAIARLLFETKHVPTDIDRIVFAGHAMKVPRTRRDMLKQFSEEGGFGGVARTALSYVIPGAFRTELRKRDRLNQLAALELDSSTASFVDAHLAASMLAYNSGVGMERRCLVICAGSGADRMAATVHVAQRGKLERIATIHEEDSLGAFCEHVTYLLGMSPQRDEGLLMDLGALTSGPMAKSAAKRFELLFEFDEMLPLNWQRASNMPETPRCHEFLRNHFRRRRFDHIAGGWHIFVNSFIAEWVGRCAHKTEIRDVILCGDLFELGTLATAASRRPEIVSMSLSPLPGSAGNSIGAAMLLAAEREEDGRSALKPLVAPYGGELGDSKTLKDVARLYRTKSGFQLEEPDSIDERVAELIATGVLVARFSGRKDLRDRGLGDCCLIARADNPPARQRMRDITQPDSFWARQAYLWKAEGLRAAFHEADTLPEQPCGEFYMTPRKPSPWFGLSAGLRVPVHAISRCANPRCWGLLDAFQQMLPTTPLITGAWKSGDGSPVRSARSATLLFEEQEVDALVLGKRIIVRDNAPILA